MSRDSFSARCHRRTNRKGLYWNCQTVRISIRMLVCARNKIAKENERNRKQTVSPVERGNVARKGRRVFPPAKFIFTPPGLRYSIDANGISVEKSTNKRNELMIINDKGRFSREDIRMNGERSGKISHRERETKGKGSRLKTTSSHIALT